MRAALFAALTAVFSQIAIPLPFTPLPINLATLSVFLAGGLLAPPYAALSQLVYIMLGAVGVPVFSGMRGGLGVLVGPTGGFIVGYVVAAFAVALIIGRRNKKRHANETRARENRLFSHDGVVAAAAMAVGAVCYFSIGTVWFMVVTGNAPFAALTMCVLPYIPGDILKIICAVNICRYLATQKRR